ncbi:hypothetical protein L873DRAFT_1470244 [Choiromyces venosus 120613-1]|uniref:Uncharacterized protein n=1 Tax=Choiromyces venosus 120613-1 TaxID=1336337 RepID=A0A3N4J7N7_9PEZI|nr:hypothetical protein L873DRAFT_1470244 [Choiromyces venosus 120613-1]
MMLSKISVNESPWISRSASPPVILLAPGTFPWCPYTRTIDTYNDNKNDITGNAQDSRNPFLANADRTVKLIKRKITNIRKRWVDIPPQLKQLPESNVSSGARTKQRPLLRLHTTSFLEALNCRLRIPP